MSAVPKKKLCWNCEGSVSREIDNCPYCGVYVHTAELESLSGWNSTQYHQSKTDEIPSPLYSLQEDVSQSEQEKTNENIEKEEPSMALQLFCNSLKQDVFPLLFLMMGSVFFLFGAILLLFAQNGTLTLQWKGSYSYYFLLAAIPLLAFGWRLLQQLHSPDDES